MKKHPYLHLAEQKLKKDYFIEFLDTNFCTLSVDKGSLPFAHLVVEDVFDGISVALSYDFNECLLVAEIMITLMHCSNVGLLPMFYQSKSGKVYLEEEAFEQWQIEKDADLLKNLNPLNDLVN